MPGSRLFEQDLERNAANCVPLTPLSFIARTARVWPERRLAGVLRSAGIASFSQLAETGVERLREILREAGFRLGDPESWLRQARLAAEGGWDELAGLQEELRRRRKSRGDGLDNSVKPS